MLSLLKSLQEQGVITQGDYYFAQLIADKPVSYTHLTLPTTSRV